VSAVVHGFDERLADGQQGEEFVRQWLGRWGTVAMVTDMPTQRRGIDMYLLPHNGSEAITIEVKTDIRAKETGRAYIETASVVTPDGVQKMGWLYTSEADRLVYYIPGQEILVLHLGSIKLELVDNQWQKYMFATAENEGYRSQGLLMPLHLLREIAAYKEKL
jgi:hypothetical protein